MLYVVVNRVIWFRNNYKIVGLARRNLLGISSKGNFHKVAVEQRNINISKGHIKGHEHSTFNTEDKIIYNSVIKNFKQPLKLQKPSYELPSGKPSVVSLKYFSDKYEDETSNLNKNTSDVISGMGVHFPYERHDSVTMESDITKVSTGLSSDDILNQETGDLTFSKLRDESGKTARRKWMKDYEKYAEVSVKLKEEQDEDIVDVGSDKYGSSDPNIPSSSIPCGGCGAHLHCQDYAIPGFLPKEIFVGLSEEQLQAVVCQRCHFLREYDTALSVSVDPQIYPTLLSQIKGRTALVILVVDMTDFPCSIWPGILDVVGPKRPLIVVGNKVDLLQDWSRDYLDRAKQALIKQLPPEANLLHVALISAKTGYGVENLVTTLYNLWEYRGDVYLVGCTNVGKSTLFNALLQSDYCKTKAVDLMQRATVSPWPGTTLNLLKFPIMRPEGWRLVVRTSRLRQQAAEDKQHLIEGKVATTPQMISNIERTWSHGLTDKYNDEHWDDPFAMPKLHTLRNMRPCGSGLDSSDPTFAQSKWLYDTPGVITRDQMLELLTTEELTLTLPREPLVPRTFQVWPGQSLLLAGLARVDYIHGPANLKMTVLAAATLPVTLCWLGDASDVYQQYLGSEVLAVPCGSEGRLRLWPGLAAAPEFTLMGMGWKQSCADVVLSSAGWVAVTAKQDTLCRLQAWTPQARGIHVRIPPVLPRAIAVKGCKLYASQAYALYNNIIKNQLKRQN